MPTEQQHIERAEQNEAFYNSLAASGHHLDWQVTVLFYTALHYVDAYLSRSGVHPHTHTERRAAVRKSAELRAIYRPYSELDDRSRDARYTETKFDVQAARDLHDNEFRRVKEHLRSLLGLP